MLQNFIIIVLPIKGLEYIKEFDYHCFYSCHELFKQNHLFLQHYKQKIINQILTDKNKKQLEEWTGLTCGEIIFHSEIDNWSQNISIFNDKINGKKQLVFLIEDEDGELFGYYLNTEIIDKQNERGWYEDQITDNKSFSFNLYSNGRLNQPMKFEIKNVSFRSGYLLYPKSFYVLIRIGIIWIMKENKKYKSFCFEKEYDFDYKGIENAICGKSNERFTIKHFVVVQMK